MHVYKMFQRTKLRAITNGEQEPEFHKRFAWDEINDDNPQLTNLDCG